MPIRVEGDRFVDEHRRTLLLRGVNLGGSSKLPRTDGSFIGRPFPLEDADSHFSRLHRWGLTTLRLVVTWEAIEHAGPRQYDLEYLDYLEALIRRAASHQLAVFIDFHQDVWSRFTGGDGAPGWTLAAAGFNLDTLHETGAAFLEARHPGPPPKMIWPTNAGKLGSATMFTLFFGADTFAPRTRIDGESAQRFHRGLLGPRVVGQQRVNPGQLRAWRDGARCLWLENGVWANEAQPRLLEPRHFSHVGGRAVSFAEDFLGPFHAEGAARIHRLAPHLAVMLQGEPFRRGPRWKGTGPAVWAPHWYDGYVLFMKDYRSFLAADSFTQRPVFGARRIRKSFEGQLARLATEARELGMPLLVGELGIAFDLRGGRAFRTGDYALQRAAMNRTLTAVEDAQVSATLWNYSADNTNARGDGWNGEDLSIFSRDSPEEGRAIEAAVRPRPLALAGTLLRYGFELKSRRFELVMRHDPSVTAPSELYVPRLHYPQGAHFEVSAGRIDCDEQRATWTHGPSAAEQTVIISPGLAPVRARG